MDQILTIAIPTYNRIDHLKQNIDFLLSQMDNRCRLIIIDNCSNEDVKTSLKSFLLKYDIHEVLIVRNEVNIGLFANILRCFELCKTDWLYIIGDDDKLYDNSLNLILEDIKKHFDYINIHYQWDPESFWNESRPMVVQGFSEYVKTIESIHHVMFLSSNLYNVRKLNKFIDLGHYFQLSSAPHLVLLLLGLNEGNNSKVLLSNNKVVDNLNSKVEEAKKWNKPLFFNNIKLLLDIPIDISNKLALFGLYKKSYSLKKYFKIYANFISKNADKKKMFLEDFKKATIYYKIYGNLTDKLAVNIFYVLLFFSNSIKNIWKILKKEDKK